MFFEYCHVARYMYYIQLSVTCCYVLVAIAAKMCTWLWILSILAHDNNKNRNILIHNYTAIINIYRNLNLRISLALLLLLLFVPLFLLLVSSHCCWRFSCCCCCCWIFSLICQKRMLSSVLSSLLTCLHFFLLSSR